MRKRVLYASSPEWGAIAERIDELIAGPGFRALKASSRTSAGFLLCGVRETFVKRVDAGRWTKGMLDRIRGSRAARALRGAEILDRAGFAHPAPLAAIETHSLGAVRSGYILTEPLQTAQILSRFFFAVRRNFRRHERISARLAGEIRRLHDAGLYTLDMQETNLMLEERDGEIKIYFIDLEDFRRTRKVPARRRMSNLIHLDRSIGRFASRSQRLRFFYNYLGGKPGREEARRLVAGLFVMRNRIDRQKMGGRSVQNGVLPSADVAPAGGFTRIGTTKK
jgi:hypothetical protein